MCARSNGWAFERDSTRVSAPRSSRCGTSIRTVCSPRGVWSERGSRCGESLWSERCPTPRAEVGVDLRHGCKVTSCLRRAGRDATGDGPRRCVGSHGRRRRWFGFALRHAEGLDVPCTGPRRFGLRQHFRLRPVDLVDRGSPGPRRGGLRDTGFRSQCGSCVSVDRASSKRSIAGRCADSFVDAMASPRQQCFRA